MEGEGYISSEPQEYCILSCPTPQHLEMDFWLDFHGEN